MENFANHFSSGLVSIATIVSNPATMMAKFSQLILISIIAVSSWTARTAQGIPISPCGGGQVGLLCILHMVYLQILPNFSISVEDTLWIHCVKSIKTIFGLQRISPLARQHHVGPRLLVHLLADTANPLVVLLGHRLWEVHMDHLPWAVPSAHLRWEVHSDRPPWEALTVRRPWVVPLDLHL